MEPPPRDDPLAVRHGEYSSAGSESNRHGSGRGLPPVMLQVAPELARLLHRLQQLRNDGALLATIDLRTLELYPALSVERLAPQPKSMLHSG